MLQGIRASTLTMPPFGTDMSLAGMQKMEGYSDAEPWTWSQHPPAQQPTYSNVFDPSVYANFQSHPQPPSRGLPRHPSVAASHVLSTATNNPPPPRPHVAGNMVKAQPAFKPTWQGFLDTTKDAMTVVEAALQGRLSHISRRPHDKERAEMLTSGTVLVYEENASGIKRWTDAVHWSPSRVMNNCLIYRQLVRALKPEEKKSALNPSCGTKRKRKETSGLATTKTGENLTSSDDEYENSAFDNGLAGDVDPMNKVYANFAQSLTPDQQRRFCGSLIDSYEFKEGGLMKKTISVKYQGTHHHVISYYSLEDVVSGKLKRPYQDPKLADIQPRPELLNGWKVSLEDEESKDMPLVGGYPHHIQPSHLQHHVIGAVTQAVGVQSVMQTHAPLHLQVPDYWHGPQSSQYTPDHHSPQHYTAPNPATSQYSNAPYSAHQASSHAYPAQRPSSQNYGHPSSPQHYPSSQSASPQYSAQAAPPPQYTSQPQTQRHYPSDYSHSTATPPYVQSTSASQYAPSLPAQTPQPPQFTVPQSSTFDVNIPLPQSSPSDQQTGQLPQQPDLQRRSSAPMALQPYTQPQYPSAPHPHSYYVTDEKYAPEAKYAPTSHHGY
ncbi:hypothetical protein T440DRAFT_276159 [Plenodomus tracheiphilus IPT5]|uniref:Camp independent regulatory protein n=1 Tax=Plenodomus tracheiphilus IPT5 TaxID=1408161 RepID=A0A6A7BGC5_9PLEO|nr:hypothetical protein T440DRAFT_276159 [Plenodomus tracheiphilus IPT5]